MRFHILLLSFVSSLIQSEFCEWKARFDGNSELVAELVALNGFKSAYAIKDGAEGPRGWLVCVPLPLIPPNVSFFKSFSIRLIYNCECFFFLSGLQNSGLPWIEPKKTLSLDLSSLTDSISDVFGVSIQFYVHFM